MQINSKNKPIIFSVSELNLKIKSLLEKKLPLIWVEGEVSNVRRPGSGHIYFTLKDEASQLSAVLFRSAASLLRFKLEDGLGVIARGQINVYTKKGLYQLVVSLLEPRGIGALQLALEQLKKKLTQEGLFERKYKKPLPVLPRKIGVVTSPSGAAIRDILQVINRRFGNVHIIINPVRVQGEGAGWEIARAIEEFNRLHLVDVLIVSRGGGSLEDLWAFNEEVVARSIFDSSIPVISAVGHEIDWTISDLVADVRAPTPSAAAELVVTRKSELAGKVIQCLRRFQTYWNFKSHVLRQRLGGVWKSYLFRDPKRMLRPHQQRLDELTLQLPRLLQRGMELRRQKLNTLLVHLESLNPISILARGYSFTTLLKSGKIIVNSRDLKSGMEVETRLHRGRFTSAVKNIKHTGEN